MNFQEFARATSRLLLILAIVAVPAAIYVFVVVGQQAESNTALNLRVVSEAGAHLDDRLQVLANIANALSFNAIVVEKLKEFGDSLSSGDVDDGACREDQLLCMRTGGKIDPLQFIEQLHTNERFRNLDLRLESDSACKAVSAIVAIEGRNVVVTKCDGVARMALVVPLGDLVEPVPLTSELYALIIADCNGHVLNASSSREVAITDVAALVPGSPNSKAATDSATDAQASNPKTRQSGSCAGPGQSWVSSGVDIGGVPTRVYGHPYRPANVSDDPAAAQAGAPSNESNPNAKKAGTSPSSAPTWFLIGLQSQDDFNHHTRVLPFELMIVILPLIVFAVLAWPFLLIWLSGPGAGFARGAPVWFASAALVGAGVVTIIVCGLTRHYDVVTLRDDLLKRVADDVDARLTGELAESLNLFVKAPSAAQMFLGRQSVAGAIEECHERLQGTDNKQERCFVQAARAGGTDLLKEYANFEFAFQANQEGVEVNPNLSLRSAYSGRPTVADRAYFQRASRGLLWRFPAESKTDSGPDVSFAIEQIRSKDFGWALSSIAVPATTSGKRDSAAVTVIIKRLQTTFEPILPVGVSFAVVQDRQGSVSLDGSAWNIGDVLIHSDDSRSLIENVLTETDEDGALAVALAERHRESLSVEYRGEPYRFYVRPLHALPWSLVVMYEKNTLRVFTWRNIIVATEAFLTYFLVMGLLVGGIELWRRRIPQFILPSAANSGLHLSAAAALLAVSVFLCLGTSAWTGPAVAPASLWLVLLGSSISVYGLLTLHFGPEHVSPERRKRGRPHRVLAESRDRARANVGATILCAIGLALLAANLLFASPSRWSFVILLGFAALFLAPTVRLRRPHDSDYGYVAFLTCLLAAVSAVPAYMLTKDAYEFHREAYEKFNVEQVALASAKRENALRNELRRLQPDIFDRPAKHDVEVPLDLWCKAYFGLGASPLFTQCPGPAGGSARATATSASEPPADAQFRGSKVRTATSLFSSAALKGGTRARVFYAVSDWSKDDESLVWSRPSAVTRPVLGDLTLVAVDEERAFAYDARGLFDSTDRQLAGDQTEHLFMSALFLGCAIAGGLTWWALLTVTRTFFGSFALRANRIPQGAAGSWTVASNEEKQVLRHLASGRFVNCARNSRTIESLWTKRFIAVDPCVRIADDATKQQARDSARSASELKFEHNQTKGTWLAVRMPFFAVLGLAVVTVLIATPQAVPSLFAILAASAGGVTVLIQIANLLMSRK